ncbi:MAG: DedA family protein [Candidatus Omnitrophica bacterium]|nr:DedA family protein [Candidatus Omnitrophota bacterium]
MIDFVIHIQRHLHEIIQHFGVWSYLILFLIVFCETGLVVTPFLPGDSLLFTAGTFAAIGSFKVLWLWAILVLAAILGDNTNYFIGKIFGERWIKNEKSKLFKKENIEKTHGFFEKYGGKTLILAQFVPIIRTFAPFVAGVGLMSYKKFLFFNVSGVLLWVSLFVFGGYYFGNIPIVKEHFSVVILMIIVISMLPAVWEIYKARSHKSGQK